MFLSLGGGEKEGIVREGVFFYVKDLLGSDYWDKILVVWL